MYTLELNTNCTHSTYMLPRDKDRNTSVSRSNEKEDNGTLLQEAVCIIRLNTSWSTLKDQCRCVTPVCASLSGYGDDNVVSDSDEVARESDAGLYSATLPLFFDYSNNKYSFFTK